MGQAGFLLNGLRAAARRVETLREKATADLTNLRGDSSKRIN
jgi:hypothetical protein